MYAELERKVCTRCEQEKVITDFYRIAGGLKPRSECKKCTNSYHNKYRATENGAAATKRARETYHASPDKREDVRQNKQEWARFKKYGITKNDYVKMLSNQNFKCAICGAPHDERNGGLRVDHCHLSGAVRGLLCVRCNTGIGMLQDSEAILDSAKAYLKSSRSRG